MLRPEVSIPVGLATATVVYGIYGQALPPMVDVRMAAPGQTNVDSAERAAAWTSAAAVAGISLIARDMTPFILGGAMIITLSWWHRHANMVIPELGKAVPKPDAATDLPDDFDTATAGAEMDNGYPADESYAA